MCRLGGTSCACPISVAIMATGLCDCQTRSLNNEFYWTGKFY